MTMFRHQQYVLFSHVTLIKYTYFLLSGVMIDLTVKLDTLQYLRESKKMDKRQDSEKKTTAETSNDTAVWDLEEDEDQRREAFELYCGKNEEELETEEERQRRKEKSEKLEEMRERWQKEESERSLEERRQLEKLGRGGNRRE